MRIHTCRGWGFTAALLCCMLAGGNPAIAQDTTGASKSRPWYETVTIDLFGSASYSYNVNVPDSRKNQERIFDTDDNSFKVDVIELAMQKPATNPGDVGFCFHLTAGSSVPKVSRSNGLDIGDLDFHQMFIRYIVNAGRGLTLDFGKFVTPCGYELIEGYDGYNDNATRSFLFGYAIPFTHTGVRAAYPFSEKVSGTVMIVNGWDNSIDNNRSKSVAGQVALTPVSELSLSFSAVYGPEQNDNDSNNRAVMDFAGSYTVSPHFTVSVSADDGSEQRSGVNGRTARWSGVAAYLRYNCSDEFSLTLRGEHFEDRDGLRTGVAQKLREVTLTPEFRPAKGLVFRGDIRMDFSDRDVFEKRGTLTGNQFTVCVNTLFIW